MPKGDIHHPKDFYGNSVRILAVAWPPPVYEEMTEVQNEASAIFGFPTLN